ncbi:ferrous iron transport protein B [Anaerococcus sp.]|uniref:ferrous iron transport protein B n=1 Tax=Anaerococcus sp. TaxID=1872515 RepID=UPI0029014DDD|nr:ferrous iron transport protein B [Anaerococcus sp.]MDU1827977.1 ferrous iron transport protein B [Anaerococcus sp.]MDU1863835.1 ferrous iron transport protein B [Anaerococcus sp.]
MSYTVALAGNPNSGKTTLFNALTGSNQRVGNWPGVTVDKKEGNLKGHKDIMIQDLPGIYSLSPYTLEEKVAREYLVEERPNLIVNLVDGSNLIRNLYLTSQFIELGIPTIIALNMVDIVKQRGDKIDKEALTELIGCPVVEIIASKEEGIDNLVEEIETARDSEYYPLPLEFSYDLENKLADIRNIIDPYTDDNLRRFYTIKAFEDDNQMIDKIGLSKEDLEKVGNIKSECENFFDDDAESIITGERYERLEALGDRILTKSAPKLSTTDKIDNIVTSRVWGIPIFALVMFLVYSLAVYEHSPGTMATEAVNSFFDDTLIPAAATSLESIGINEILIGLVTDGILSGVGAVLGFLPQMMVLFALLSILEDIGYMSRVAFIMDRLFRRFGLSGKSFIPAMVSTGCAVPGIQASRTIENDRDRRLTIMTTSFMPCSAKLPVIALIAGAFFPTHRALITFSFYFIGIVAIVISGVILKKFKKFASDPAPFIMELPPYHAPRLKSVLQDVWNKTKAYAKRAGTVILLSAILIWFLSNFDFRLNLVEEDGSNSILGVIGSSIAVIFAPLGFNTWQAVVATISGFIAKENVVSTMGVVLGLGSDITEESQELLVAFNTAIGTPIAGYSFLLFNMLCMPCFAAVGAIKTEMGDRKWTWLTIGYQMGFSYVISFIFYQLASLITYGTFTAATVIAFLALIGLLYLLFRPQKAVSENNTYKRSIARS